MKALIEERAATIFGDGEQSRDFTHVSLVVQANLNALALPLPAGSCVVNIACGQSTSINHLHELLAGLLGKQQCPVHEPDRNGDIRDSLADISAARDLLGKEVEATFVEGLM